MGITAFIFSNDRKVAAEVKSRMRADKWIMPPNFEYVGLSAATSTVINQLVVAINIQFNDVDARLQEREADDDLLRLIEDLEEHIIRLTTIEVKALFGKWKKCWVESFKSVQSGDQISEDLLPVTHDEAKEIILDIVIRLINRLHFHIDEYGLIDKNIPSQRRISLYLSVLEENLKTFLPMIVDGWK
jgi:hypothetical protein